MQGFISNAVLQKIAKLGLKIDTAICATVVHLLPNLQH